MKTKVHTIKGASLRNIEELDHLGTPDWVPYTVAVAGTETSALDEVMVQTMHYSGLLRSCSNYSRIDETHIDDEDGEQHHIGELLDGAAERLDQAHEEWLEVRKHQVRHRDDLLNDDELADLKMILTSYCEDCDSSRGAAKMVDAIWNKIREAKSDE